MQANQDSTMSGGAPRQTPKLPSTESQSDRLRTIRQLLDMFRMERIVYLVVTLVSVTALLTCAVMLLIKREAPYAAMFGLFGASGGITYSTGRLLRMWSDAIRILDPKFSENDEK